MPQAKDPASDTAATMRSGVVTRLMSATPMKFQDACESDEGATLPVLTLAESRLVTQAMQKSPSTLKWTDSDLRRGGGIRTHDLFVPKQSGRSRDDG